MTEKRLSPHQTYWYAREGRLSNKIVFLIVYLGVILHPLILFPLVMGHVVSLLTLTKRPTGFFVKWRAVPRRIDFSFLCMSTVTWILLPFMFYDGVKGFENTTILYSAIVIWFYTVKLFWEVLFRDDYIRDFNLRTGSQELQIERQPSTYLATKSLVEYCNLIFWFVLLYTAMAYNGSIVFTDESGCCVSFDDSEINHLDFVRESFLMMVAFGPENMQAVTWQAKVAMLTHSFTGLFMTGVLFSRLFHIEDRE